MALSSCNMLPHGRGSVRLSSIRGAPPSNFGAGETFTFIDLGGSESYGFRISTLESNAFRRTLEKSLEAGGYRVTRQRQEVFEIVAESHDHPTADELFDRVKRRMPEISFATVYNCLSVLVQCGLVRQVTLDRSPTRFCPNMREHCHFFCEKCGEVTDIDLPSRTAFANVALPRGFEVASFDVSLRGVCPHCGAKAGAKSGAKA
jgi:Fur family peroxide stress response transcriptional regulator